MDTIYYPIYLDFSSQHLLQHNYSVTRTLFDRVKCIMSDSDHLKQVQCNCKEPISTRGQSTISKVTTFNCVFQLNHFYIRISRNSFLFNISAFILRGLQFYRKLYQRFLSLLLNIEMIHISQNLASTARAVQLVANNTHSTCNPQF